MKYKSNYIIPKTYNTSERQPEQLQYELIKNKILFYFSKLESLEDF